MKKKRIKNLSDFPMEYYTGKPRIEFYGTDECVVDGLKSIIKYSADEIILNVGKTAVKFLGSDLHINSFSPEGAVVNGFIMSMEFSGND